METSTQNAPPVALDRLVLPWVDSVMSVMIAKNCKTCDPDRYLRFVNDRRQLWVHCDGCGAEGPPCNTAAEAAEAWNNQQEQP